MQRIYDKTDKGREEIATRKYKLAPRLRTLLLLVDGKQTIGQVLQKVAGLDEQSIAELVDSGFIQSTDVDDAEVIDDQKTPVAEQVETAPEVPAAEVPPGVPSLLAEGETKFDAIRKFYTENIRATLGLRGYNYQLKVDQAKTVGDLLALHAPYMAAVLKAKGAEIATEQHRRLDQLFALEDTPAAPE